MRAISENRDDAQAVVDAASALHISEFDLFCLAYRNWFGYAPERGKIDACFSHYVDDALVPMWVRAFARRVNQLRAEGRLDPRDFDLPLPVRGNAWMGFLGIVSLTLMAAYVALLVYLAANPGVPGTPWCQFPPCY